MRTSNTQSPPIDNILRRKRMHTPLQIFRYGAIGLTINSLGYSLYLIATAKGADPKVAMSALYAVGVIISFLANRKIVFSYVGSIFYSFIRFLATHILGYTLNFTIMTVMVDKMGYPHELAQACGIIIVAGFLFISFKFFVFPNHKTTEAPL